MKKILIGLFILTFLLIVHADDIMNSKEYYDREYVLVFETKGNFIDSRKKSSLYGYVGTYDYNDDGLQAVICTAPNSRTKVYPVGEYWSNAFGVSAKESTSDSPLKRIGTEIKIGDTVFGYIADINDNGLDELYLFRQTGVGFSPTFYEYSPKENAFVSIIEYDGAANSLELQTIDIAKKMLTFKGYAVANTLVDEDVIYAWNDRTEKYEIIKRTRIPRN